MFKKLEEFNNYTKKLGEVSRKSDVEDGKTQTSAIQNIISTQSLRDTLALMERNRNFMKLVEKDNGDVFSNGVISNQWKRIESVSKVKSMI